MANLRSDRNEWLTPNRSGSTDPEFHPFHQNSNWLVGHRSARPSLLMLPAPNQRPKTMSCADFLAGPRSDGVTGDPAAIHVDATTSSCTIHNRKPFCPRSTGKPHEQDPRQELAAET